MTIRDLTSWVGLARGLSAFAFCRRASVAVESVAYVAFMVGMTGTAFEFVKAFNAGDILERAAYAAARDHVLQETMPSDATALENRAWEAIKAEVGESTLDRSLLDIDFKVYLNPTKMLADEESTDKYNAVGGGPGDMVVVQLTYKPTTGFAWMRRQLGQNVAFAALAVARNELALAEAPASSGQLSNSGSGNQGSLNQGNSQGNLGSP